MKDEKIKHPFQVPDNFHSEFKKELLNTIQKKENYSTTIIKLNKYARIGLKYAAIIAIAFLFGRLSKKIDERSLNENIQLETIYNQVSEDDIIDFLIEDNLINEL